MIESGAKLSEDGVYRYDLWRKWADGPLALWIMLNPSTADAELDDPTVRRCRGFSEQWGYGSLAVVNLFAYRTTDPANLPKIAVDARGPENAETIQRWMKDPRTSAVIAAWGVWNSRVREVARFNVEGEAFRWGHDIFCLGTTKDGHPRHPLYVPATQPLELFAKKIV